MTRFPDWQLKFAACVDKHRSIPFAWGTHDCVLWASNVILAMTGIDPAKAYRGKYNSALTAAKIIGTTGLGAMASQALGKTPVDVKMANVGDLLLVKQDGQELLAICNGDTVLAPGKNGLITLPISLAVQAWRI